MELREVRLAKPCDEQKSVNELPRPAAAFFVRTVATSGTLAYNEHQPPSSLLSNVHPSQLVNNMIHHTHTNRTF
ncbi:unnamed protein product [Danaus chrysippus]|uniref:(African queen) hypothetical protein n=1 Tax=Danaus chrysippus TaxID=151541 RepID=A0A8J2RE83_9NEOP|nr:unnamed protein product [Danaus chrysippus]